MAILALLIAVPILHWASLAKARHLTLLAGFVIIGLWQKSPISLSNIAAVLAGNAAPPASAPFWEILLAGALMYILALGKNLYCHWLCPMGAIAEGCAKAGEMGALSGAAKSRHLERYKKLRLILAWLSLTLGFALLSPGLASFEIFAPLFALSGNSAQWAMLPFFLFAGVFIKRFWCRFFCPVGAILDFLASVRGKAARWTRKKKKA